MLCVAAKESETSLAFTTIAAAQSKRRRFSKKKTNKKTRRLHSCNKRVLLSHWGYFYRIRVALFNCTKNRLTGIGSVLQ